MTIQFSKILLLIVNCLLLVRCTVDSKKIINPHKPQYKITDPSELFFKNVRALYYNREENQTAKLEVFRIKNGAESNDSTVLNLAIVLNWRFDEAYILIEPGKILDDVKSVTLLWEDESEGAGESAEFTLGDKNSQFTLASIIYGHILKGHHLYYLKKGKKWPLLKSKKAREAFRITMFDFYNLVELL